MTTIGVSPMQDSVGLPLEEEMLVSLEGKGSDKTFVISNDHGERGICGWWVCGCCVEVCSGSTQFPGCLSSSHGLLVP